MPPRISRSSAQGSVSAKSRQTARNPKKAQKRALNAFAIAQHEDLDKPKIRRHRLGEIEGSAHRKRSRGDDEDEEDEDDEEGGGGAPKRRKHRSGDESLDEGSDSEGNAWTMGYVDDEDDEDIDSDEAFGESDEERFEGFTFRGSSKVGKKGGGKQQKRKGEVDEEDGIDLHEEREESEEDEEDDFGEEGIDLATALDQYVEDEEEERRRAKKNGRHQAFSKGDGADSEDKDMDTEAVSDISSDENEEEEANRQAQLKDLISSLATSDEKAKSRRTEVHESAVPDEFGISKKVDILSFKPKVADEEKKRALKLLQDDKRSKRNDIARKLDAPLPKRQQDKLDRAAANEKAKETLDRWTDTIKQNRRAEHLIFPLQKDEHKIVGETRLQPTTTETPTNDLESTIQSILQQSGLSNGKEDEEQIQKWEELQTNKLPIDEVMKRRAQLRQERDLLFREEVRARRIKKIKSKAYRRVHRKEREKLMQRERDQLKADGVDLSEEEREYNDRRRAEERMGAKHRESKWAKGIKATGRAGWDEDALAGVTEMARRNEELRRRIEGKKVRDNNSEGSDLSSEDESEEASDDDENAVNGELSRSLTKLKQNPFSTDTSRLGQMAFMQKAEAAKRAQNDEDIERIRRELNGEDSVSEEENDNATRVGRRKYGPGNDLITPFTKSERNEFEEGPDSGDEDAGFGADVGETIMNGEQSSTSRTAKKRHGVQSGGLSKAVPETRKAEDTMYTHDESHSSNPFLKSKSSHKKGMNDSELIRTTNEPQLEKSKTKPKLKQKSNSKGHVNLVSESKTQETTVDGFLQQRITAVDDDGWATVVGGANDDGEDDNGDSSEGESIDLNVLTRNQTLAAKGFAGDNVEAEFVAEKKATIAEEESAEITSILPGWGSWTGSGMSTAEKKRNKGLVTVTKKEGIDADKRKDRKLAKVIINEKRVKPNIKYMASQLPFPFETKEQYERSLRLPKGKEWTSKRTFQDATKPRVIVGQGIIAPLRKPFV